MPRVVNIGSINIDHVYRVPHVVHPGETLAATRYDRFPGGKGFNQSIALARAGVPVAHAGYVGRDGLWLRERLADEGVDVSALLVTDDPTGQAFIQVTPEGENAILIHGAANRSLTTAAAEALVAACRHDDRLLLQHEISSIPAILQAAHARGLPVIFNPAPMEPAVRDYPLDAVRLFVVNQVEASQLVGPAEPREQLRAMRERFPAAHALLTLGRDGVMAATEEGIVQVPGFPIEPVDTTAAGDTFIGYFLAHRLRGAPLDESLRQGCAAAACCCLKPGAADAIPSRATVAEFLQDRE